MAKPIAYAGGGRAGFTLVEAMVAVFVLGLFIAGACSLIVMVREQFDRARDSYTAVNLAKNRIERMKSFDYQQLGYFVENGTVVDSTGVADGNGNFRRTTVVSNVSPNLIDMVVTVQIRDRETLAFDGEQLMMCSYHTDYAEMPEE